MVNETLPAAEITPVHLPSDVAKLAGLAASMRANGWQGEPLLALRHGDGLQAWTGAHRLAAASETGIEVPVYVFELTGEQAEELEASGWFRDGLPQDQECILAELELLEGVDPEAVRIYRGEIEKER